jgi:hypothetical protein
MKPTAHFVLSIGGPIFAAVMAVSTLYALSDWLEEKRLPFLPLALIGFVAAWVLARWLVHHFAWVACPKCGAKSYEMDGVSSRFRCQVCGKAF